MDKEQLKEYLYKGSDIAAGAAGAAIGLVGGPTGAVLGGVIGPGIAFILKDVINWKLSNRQEVRVAASADYMISGIQNQLDQGKQVRNDAFFDEEKSRSSAKELFEGILLKCKDQYQEKKVKYISKIFEKTAFDANISAEIANQILTTAESLTYRKLCIISFFGRKNEYNAEFLMKEVYSWYQSVPFSIELEVLQQDIFDLVNLGIIDTKNNMIITRKDVIPYKFALTGIGNVFFEAMELIEMPKEDIDPIYEELKYKDEFGVSSQGTVNGVRPK